MSHLAKGCEEFRVEGEFSRGEKPRARCRQQKRMFVNPEITP